MFVVSTDPTPQQNGDLAIRSDKGRLAALVYATGLYDDTLAYAECIAAALNAAFPEKSSVQPDLLATIIECRKQINAIIEDGVATDWRMWRDDLDALIAKVEAA
jgi:hypothetical protein